MKIKEFIFLSNISNLSNINRGGVITPPLSFEEKVKSIDKKIKKFYFKVEWLIGLKQLREVEMIRLKTLAREKGVNYSTLRYWTIQFESQLVDKGILKVEKSFKQKNYFVLTDPDSFLEAIKVLIERRSYEKRNSETSSNKKQRSQTC